MKNRVILCALFLLCLQPCYAQQFYTKGDYIRLYLENDPDYMRAKTNLEISENDYEIAFMQMFLPSAALNAGSILAQKGDRFFNSLEDRGLAVGASASWNLFNTGKDMLSIRNKKLALEKQRVSFEELKQTTAIDAMTVYQALVYRQALLQVAKDDLEEQAKQYDIDKRKFEGGHKTALDLMQSEINWRTSQLSMAEAQVDYNTSLKNLNIAINRPPLEAVEIDKNLDKVEMPKTDLDFDLSYAMNNNYSVIKDRLSLKQADISEKLDYLSNLPSLTVDASASTGRTFSSGDSGEYTNYSISAGISVPLGFFWIDKYKGIKNAKLTAQTALYDSESIIRSVTSDVILMRSNLELQIQSLEIAVLRLDIATKKFDVTQQKYNQSLATYLELSDARTDYLNSQNSYLSFANNLSTTYARYKNVLGRKVID